MNYMPCFQMMNPSLCCSPIAEYPTDKLENMYPEIYYRLYPKIRQRCIMMDVPGQQDMYPNPSRAAVERMTDDIYRELIYEMGMPEEDDCTDDRQFVPYGVSGYQGYGFGGRRFLRDLVGVLLIRELLGRRGFYY